MQTNLLSQHSITVPQAIVPNTLEEKTPKSVNGEGVKNSRKQVTTSTINAQDSRLCFRCKQLGHLKKDYTELPYCSKCQTQVHIPAKCPTKKQDGRWQDERCKNADERCITHREDWMKAQDRLQFSNRTSKCLNCAGNHGMHDCPTRQQPHTHPIGNPANGTGIYKIIHNFKIIHPSNIHNKVHLQLAYQPSQIPPVSQQADSPIRHNQFNQHFQ